MTTIKLQNTRTRTKEVFTPIDPDNVRMYVCGPTVYDRAHLGNARPVVVFDVLYRLLRHVYGPDHVTYVRNFTDVDDKIIKRAEESGREISQITEETTQWFLDDMGALGALEPDAMPRATQYIPQMVAMIEELIAGGHAYAAEGHVLFAVESYKTYGKLSGRAVDDMIAGARVEVAPYKRNPMDFVLWKPSEPDQPGWESPWGRGRPGWHIECSAMSYELLGESFDIHGGGNDLMFPHHENEIAQSCCAHPQGEFARYWLHNEMVLIEGEKMSKSLGNFVTVHDIRGTMLGRDRFVPRREWLESRRHGERISARPLRGLVIRLSLLMTHYRDKLDWTFERVLEADRIYNKLQFSLRGADIDFRTYRRQIPRGLLQALSDDLNTPGAIQVLIELSQRARKGDQRAATELLAGMEFLGLIQEANVKRIALQRAISTFVNAVEDLENLGIRPDTLLDFIEESSGKDYRQKAMRAFQKFAFFSAHEDAKKISASSDRAHPEMSSRDREEAVSKVSQAEIERMIDKRIDAKRNKDFTQADKLRDQLKLLGVEIVDTPNGPRWRLAK